MAATAVLIPYLGGCPHRDAALGYVIRRYRDEQPDWQVVVGYGDHPWVKADAVADALDQTDAPVIVVADADVWCDALPGAVDAVANGGSWAVPHHAVHRLTPDATEQVLAGAPLGPDLECEARPYKGILGGGLVALRRDLYDEAPLDPRFVGWGQEDSSWAVALRTLAGLPTRLGGSLYHLWHPHPARQSRRIGNEANAELERRYMAARRNMDMMAALIGETR